MSVMQTMGHTYRGRELSETFLGCRIESYELLSDNHGKTSFIGTRGAIDGDEIIWHNARMSQEAMLNWLRLEVVYSHEFGVKDGR